MLYKLLALLFLAAVSLSPLPQVGPMATFFQEYTTSLVDGKAFAVVVTSEAPLSASTDNTSLKTIFVKPRDLLAWRLSRSFGKDPPYTAVFSRGQAVILKENTNPNSMLVSTAVNMLNDNYATNDAVNPWLHPYPRGIPVDN